MYVKLKMTANPYTVTPDTNVVDAYELLHQHKIRRLPVVDKGKLVGIVTEKELQQVSPSKATTLSVYEINYLLAKTKVKDAMYPNPICTTPDALLEEAAVLMRDNNVGALPVIDHGKLVGIITETDIFDAFTELMGIRDIGTRITVEAKDSPGILSELANIISSFGVNITRIAVYQGEYKDTSDVVIRMSTLETEKIEEALEHHGYKIIHKLKNQ